DFRRGQRHHLDARSSASIMTFVMRDARSDPTSSRCQIPRAPRPIDAMDARRREFVFSTDKPRSTSERNEPAGGANRIRTDDLMLAKHALSQLSYGPVARGQMSDDRRQNKSDL